MRRLILTAALAGAGLCGPAAGATDYVPNSMCAHAEPVDLPELLRASDGSRITTVAAWEKRRVELLDYFTRNVYGVRPVERPSDLRFEPIGADVEFPEIPAVRKRVRLSFSGPRGAWSFAACAFLPKGASPERPVPAFLLICNRDLAQFADIDRKVKSGFFPVFTVPVCSREVRLRCSQRASTPCILTLATARSYAAASTVRLISSR